MTENSIDTPKNFLAVKKQLGQKILSIVAVVLASVLLAAILYFPLRYISAKKAAKNYSLPQTMVPLTFVIYGTSDSTVSGIFRLFDLDGREIATLERSWAGSTLYLDFINLSLDGKTFYFPYRLYSSITLSNKPYGGTKLDRYYLTKNNCRIYESQTKNSAQLSQKNISSLAHFAHYAITFPFTGDYCTLKRLNVGSLQPGRTYRVEISDKTLRVVEE